MWTAFPKADDRHCPLQLQTKIWIWSSFLLPTELMSIKKCHIIMEAQFCTRLVRWVYFFVVIWFDYWLIGILFLWFNLYFLWIFRWKSHELFLVWRFWYCQIFDWERRRIVTSQRFWSITIWHCCSGWLPLCLLCFTIFSVVYIALSFARTRIQILYVCFYCVAQIHWVSTRTEIHLWLESNKSQTEITSIRRLQKKACKKSNCIWKIQFVIVRIIRRWFSCRLDWLRLICLFWLRRWFLNI